MIGYLCKYTPVGLLSLYDQNVVLLEPEDNGCSCNDGTMHPNQCSYAMAILAGILEIKNDLPDAVILTACCDSIKRLYDVLKQKNIIKFLYLLDVPRKTTPESVKFFAAEIRKLDKELSEFYKKKVLLKDIRLPSTDFYIENDISKSNSNNASILLTGARCTNAMRTMIKKAGGCISADITCNNINKKSSIEKLGDHSYRTDDLYTVLSEKLLYQFPCMRMLSASEERLQLVKKINNLDGIICHSVKFCDYYSFEYSALIEDAAMPVLKLETDYSVGAEGQLKTRIEAFMECIAPIKVSKGESSLMKNNKKKYFVGIDSGSTSTNAVILNGDSGIIASHSVRTGCGAKASADRAYRELLNNTDINNIEIAGICATGYGRDGISFADGTMTEIACHAKGIHYVNNSISTIIDIGGQDSKVILLDDNGNVTDFAMNDKCAAGTGRFLEMMARALDIDLQQMGDKSSGWDRDIIISSMCSVFAEAEVVSLVADDIPLSDILHGINNAVAKRTIAMMTRMSHRPGYAFTGGVAKNTGVASCLKAILKEQVYIYKAPELTGALGAALLAMELK